ncbi:MAG: cystathionine gamma-synthase [Kangiellaceae bacterium]|jgi:cystathionine gamma-synthase|nr:cystathionine gamma-synthase [Kangiellaceae bacterium]
MSNQITPTVNNRLSSGSSLASRAVRAGIDCDSAHGAVTPALYLSSNYSFAGFNQPRQYDYSRSGNPTRDLLADALAELEGGAGGVITSTGMSAILLIAHLVCSDDLIVIPHDCYGGTYRLFTNLAKNGQFKLATVDQNNPQALAQIFKQQPKLLWIETPSNPLLRTVDIEKLSKLAHQQACLVAVDNTFLTPFYQQPLALGADIVIHSTTKYINGHSDVVGGCAIAKTEELAEQLQWWANCLGITASPFDSLLTLRGLRTLDARLRVHRENTQIILDFLAQEPLVTAIYHPSLENHPGHLVAKKQQKDFGIMLSFELAGDQDTIITFIENLSVFTLAESLGGVESLVCHPATMTHAAMDETARKTAGISNTLLRLSVGIEHSGDLIADLTNGFSAVRKLQKKNVKFIEPAQPVSPLASILEHQQVG